jgi:hypothetical protein
MVGGLPNNSYKFITENTACVLARLCKLQKRVHSTRKSYGFVNYKKGCTRLAAASHTVYQLLAHGRWFSPGTPASSITKTGRHDIAKSCVKTLGQS